MSAQLPPDSATPFFIRPRRTYLACLNCRKQKIKCLTAGEDTPCERCTRRGLECEYKAVSEVQANSASPPRGGGEGRRGTVQEPPPPSKYKPTPGQHPSRGSGGTTRRNPLYSGHSYSVPSGPTPMYPGNNPTPQAQFLAGGHSAQYNYAATNPAAIQSTPMYQGTHPPSQPQFPTSGPSNNQYSHSGAQRQLPQTTGAPPHASSGLPNQQHGGSSGYSSDYDRYMANFGLPPSYPPNM
ncbi:hypothetical protein DFH09DRAFT_1277392 [Mycena vulgaris]|nr:hypothetical protein DFH09DRAFT_1277392 [Mycena vulgaris]